MTNQDLNRLYMERINSLAPYIRSIPDQDLLQESLIGFYQALKTDPNGTDRYLNNKARWNQISAIKRGRSVDNGFYKRQDLKIVHYHQLPFDDGVFAEVISENRRIPVDDQVIEKICLERLLESLTGPEMRFLKYKLSEELSNSKIMKKLRISHAKLKGIKAELRFKINQAFAE